MSYSTITSVRRATLSTLGSIDPKTSNWPAPPFVNPFPNESQRADHHRCSSVPVPSLCLFWGALEGRRRARLDRTAMPRRSGQVDMLQYT